MVTQLFTPRTRVFLDKDETMPFLKVTPENLEITSHLLRLADLTPFADIIKELNSEGFVSYVGGSSVYNYIFRMKKRDYSDIDILAVHSDPGYLSSQLIQDLRHNSLMPIRRTLFSVQNKLFEGGYAGGMDDARFYLTPKIRGLRKILGKPAVIDLNFQRPSEK